MSTAFCVFAVLWLINVNIVSSQLGLPSPKSCAEFNIVPMNNFDKDRYLGQWFYPQRSSASTMKCIVDIRTSRSDGNQDLTTVLVKPSLPKRREIGVAIFDQVGKGHYKLQYPDLPLYSYEYTVLKTDYVTYFVEAACEDVPGGGSLVHYYVGCRTPIVPASTKKITDDIIAEHGFDTTTMRSFDLLSSCPKEVLDLADNGGLLGGVLGLVGGVLALVGGLLSGVLGILG